MRAIAVTTLERTKLFPELPPLADTAELKGFDITSWNGVYAPAGAPKPIITTLNLLADTANSAEFRERAGKVGFDAFGGTPTSWGHSR